MNPPYSYDGPSVYGYETDGLRRVASISVHTSPLANLGGKDAGGMNVYVRELSCHVAALGLPVDIFTRRTSSETPEIQTICENVNLVTISAGPPEPVDKNALHALLPSIAEGDGPLRAKSGRSLRRRSCPLLALRTHRGAPAEVLEYAVFTDVPHHRPHEKSRLPRDRAGNTVAGEQ